MLASRYTVTGRWTAHYRIPSGVTRAGAGHALVSGPPISRSSRSGRSPEPLIVHSTPALEDLKLVPGMGFGSRVVNNTDTFR